MDVLHNYIRHVILGEAIRHIAREHNVHASTILRQIRKVEQRRDDLLVDWYFNLNKVLETFLMKDDVLEEAHALRQLCKKNTTVIASPGLEQAIVMQSCKGKDIRVAMLPTTTVAEWAARGYLQQIREGKVTQYRLTPAGKKKALEADAAAGYLARQEEMNAEELKEARAHTQQRKPQPVASARKRYSIESPITMMYARKSNRKIITERGYHAAARLAEEFAHSRLATTPISTIDWANIGMRLDETILDNQIPHTWFYGDLMPANDFEKAMRHVGIGLADIVLLFVCYEYGIETCEKALGWSARSGKIVLGIALERLADHYEKNAVAEGMIGVRSPPKINKGSYQKNH